jgi:hypothetical protein
MNAHVVRDGTRVTFLVTNFSAMTGTPYYEAVRAFAIGDHAVVRKRALMPEDHEPEWEVETIGWLRAKTENTRWCRGWKGRAAKALCALATLENSR